MSEYLDRIKKFSENKKLIYAEKPWLKAIDHIEQLEAENAELREEKKKLCESMLNVIGCVRLVSEDAYKCIHRDFIKKLKEQSK